MGIRRLVGHSSEEIFFSLISLHDLEEFAGKVRACWVMMAINGVETTAFPTVRSH